MGSAPVMGFSVPEKRDCRRSRERRPTEAARRGETSGDGLNSGSDLGFDSPERPSTSGEGAAPGV